MKKLKLRIAFDLVDENGETVRRNMTFSNTTQVDLKIKTKDLTFEHVEIFSHHLTNSLINIIQDGGTNHLFELNQPEEIDKQAHNAHDKVAAPAVAFEVFGSRISTAENTHDYLHKGLFHISHPENYPKVDKSSC